MQLPKQTFNPKDKIFFISNVTATRVTRGTIKEVDEERKELLVRYKTVQGYFALCIVKMSNALKEKHFVVKNSGRSHLYTLANVRNQLVIAPTVVISGKKVTLALGGHTFNYFRSSVITGNFIPQLS